MRFIFGQETISVQTTQSRVGSMRTLFRAKHARATTAATVTYVMIQCTEHRFGYTLAAALNQLGTESQVVVVELVPAVVAWNRGPLATLAGHPLGDDRVTVREIDVVQIIRAEHRAYDAILLEVDNGPRGLTRKSNNWLYTRAGLDAAFAAQGPAGICAVWSANPDRGFTQLLRKVGFEVDEERVRVRGRQDGGYHTIWTAGRCAASAAVLPVTSMVSKCLGLDKASGETIRWTFLPFR
jgi:hypothetical protein